MGADNPTEWARDNRADVVRCARRIGEITARSRDVCLPGVPLALVFAFFANNGLDENTTGWLSGSAREREEALAKGRKPLGGNPREGYGAVTSDDLHELGPGGVEGGHCPDEVATGDCPWVTLARSSTVAKILGRPGVEGRAWHGAHDDQVAIGCANIARHARQMRTKIDPRLAWADDAKPWTLWRFNLARMSWSAGTGGAARHLARYADALAAVPEPQRWGALVRLASTYDGDGRKHARPSYTINRAAQMDECARLCVDVTGEGAAALAFLADGLDADREQVYAALVRASS